MLDDCDCRFDLTVANFTVKAYGELPETAQINEGSGLGPGGGEENDGFEFAEEEGESEDELDVEDI